jgi:flavin-dependent dehydrogenase
VAARDRVDVVVIGGGTAGAATSRALARGGTAVLLLERTDGQRVRPGEMLPPAARPLLVALDVWERFLADTPAPVLGVLSAWGTADISVNDFIVHPYGNGWHIDRGRFDRTLRQAAIEAGARVCLDTMVEEARWREPCWHVVYRRGEERREAVADVLVDARGRSALGLGAAARLVYDDLMAVLATFPDDGQVRDDDDFTLVESCPDGWFYSARLPSRELVVAYMTDADYVAGGRHVMGRAFHDALAAAAHTSRRIGGRQCRTPLRAAPSHTSVWQEPGAPARVPVGDAAFSLDPLSANGLCHALASARAASEAIRAHLDGHDGALARYGDDARTMFGRQLSARQRYYSEETRWPQSSFWRRRSVEAAPAEGRAPGVEGYSSPQIWARRKAPTSAL